MMSSDKHYFLALISLYAITSAVADYKHLHVKYALWDGFYSLPLTLSEVGEDNPPKYVKMSRDERLNVDLYSYHHDPRVSIMFDTHGNIAGLRTAYIKEDVGKRAQANGVNFTYSYDDKDMYTSGIYWGVPVWYTSVLFTSPDKLRAGGRKHTEGVVADEIYMKLDGVWTYIPKNECKAEEIGFTKQACFMGMGMHYFYKVTPTSQCGDLQGAFLLYEKGKLIGLGFNPFGTFTNGQRKWFEDVPPKLVKDIVPNGPECLTEWVSNFGSTSFHVFFKRFPRLTICTWPWQKSDQCKNE